MKLTLVFGFENKDKIGFSLEWQKQPPSLKRIDAFYRGLLAAYWEKPAYLEVRWRGKPDFNMEERFVGASILGEVENIRETLNEMHST